MEKRNIGGWMMVIIFISWILASGESAEKGLLKNGVLVNATVTDVVVGEKGLKTDLLCRFEYNGRQYTRSAPNTYCGNVSALIGKVFPAVFLPGSKNFEILITQDDFINVSMPCSDSMRRAIDYTMVPGFR